MGGEGALGSITLTEVGQVADICPNCRSPLDRRPLKKTACPHCGGSIFVRTRPLGRVRVLASQVDADEIERQWQDRERLRDTLTLDRSFTEGPIAYEKWCAGLAVDWQVLIDIALAKLNQDVGRKQWGLASTGCSRLAELSYFHGRRDLAIEYSLLGLTIGSSGPTNGGGWRPGPSNVLPGAVQRAVRYFDQPDWLTIMKVMGEAVEAVASWGGDPAWEELRDELERQMISKFGPQGALEGTL